MAQTSKRAPSTLPAITLLGGVAAGVRDLVEHGVVALVVDAGEDRRRAAATQRANA